MYPRNDDTLVIGTNEELFARKCNIMLEYFDQNKLKLNLGKSGYMIITADNKTRREKLMLNNGYIKYKHSMKYLGVLISDTGSIMKDVDLFINDKRGHIYIYQIYKLLF